jgi:hypothetical protein
MLLHLSVLLAAALHAVAQAPDVPHGGGACATDWDCSLGGECSASGACVCDTWWTGPTCAQVNLQPADPAACGLVAPGYLSWGGHPLRDNAGTYHLLASFLCNHATLSEWTTKSSIAHATSPYPTGPFAIPEGLDAQMALPPWSHGAYVVQDPPSGEYLLWHLGNATVARDTWYPCYNSSDAAGGGAAPAAAAAGALQTEPGGRQVFVERSRSLAGPWTAYNNNTGAPVHFPPDSWTQLIDNPAPFIFENGTTLLYFKGKPCPAGWGALAPMCIGVARADTWQGPYTVLFSQPITHPEGEDPAVFKDPRGNMHMLTNVNTWHNRCAASIPCGGHAWSRDGLTWSNQSIGAFGPVVRWRNGTYFVGAYAERPQVLQAQDGTPLAFFTGFGMRNYSDSHNFAQLFCTPAALAAGECGPTQLPQSRALAGV